MENVVSKYVALTGQPKEDMMKFFGLPRQALPLIQALNRHSGQLYHGDPCTESTDHFGRRLYVPENKHHYVVIRFFIGNKTGLSIARLDEASSVPCLILLGIDEEQRLSEKKLRHLLDFVLPSDLRGKSFIERVKIKLKVLASRLFLVQFCGLLHFTPSQETVALKANLDYLKKMKSN